jgi:hypothetical protein
LTVVDPAGCPAAAPGAQETAAVKFRPLVLGLTLLAPAAAPAADLDLVRPAPRVIVEERVAFEPALIERVEVVRIAPARRFVVFEDEPAVLYPRRAWFPRAGWPAPARVGRIVYDIPRGPRYNRPVRLEPVPSDPPCLC